MTDLSNATIIELAAAIASHLGKNNIKVVLVGGLAVEFPSAPLFVGDDFVNETTTISVGNSEIPILHAIDVVKDRLAAYFHWNDRPSLAQAITVMICHGIKPVDVESFCVREMKAEEFPFIAELYSMSEKQNFKTMGEVENLVLQEYLKRQ